MSLWDGPLCPDRVALVTGGAGAIGAASCRALSDHGASVVVVDIHAERTAEVVRELGGEAHGIVADLTVDGAVAAAVAEAESVFGRVDVLVNALGEHLGLAAPFEESTEEGWDRLYRVNLLHVMQACRAVLPGMKARGWGRIVNFSSVEGIRSMPRAAPYTAFKGAIDSFTKSLGVEVAPDGVRVNCIAVDKTRSHQVGFYEQPPEYEAHVPVWVPAGHLADADEVAGVVLFLASELSGWIVGQTIPADGGTLAAGGWYRTPSRWTNSPLLVQWIEPSSTTEGRPPMFR